ncbi:hypothetical protein GOBAR_AA36432 [Gossypium barbadense]|uniref:Uncharacterized protein n=1 Tax=Gossypium barbadense TaxID=3634 RepID=A0A2P5VZL8_GOSBA|nr:hypothetical protein GOBAR_AA36432 [Gossypium barbadense]
MYDEFLELRVLESDRFESGGGYSGGRKGSLGHKSYAKRILYLVVAMVMVEQDMAVVENHFLRCQHMKSPHELDERVVVTEPVGPRAVGGHHQECPRRRPPR